MTHRDYPTRLGPHEVAAAVYCGANTPERLAREWSITPGLAESLMRGANAARLIWSDGDVFAAMCPSGTTESVIVWENPEGRAFMRKVWRQRAKKRHRTRVRKGMEAA